MHFDMANNEVLEVIDHGVTPLPPNRASYYAEDQPQLRDGLKPISITQPEGVSFTVDGNRVDWQKLELPRRRSTRSRASCCTRSGTTTTAAPGRSCTARRSARWSCPTAIPRPLHGWKNAFDAGEWGLGRMTQPLTLGCDCLGEIYYFDATLANEQGKPWVIPNAICMHEEDYGILWKHVDLQGGRSEVRRSRRLVVSFVATVGNYEYGFFWYFYLDGNIQLEVKLTGIVSPMAIEPGTQPPFANVIAEGVAAPHHQHLFNARLDFDVDGADQRGVRDRRRAHAARARQPVAERVPPARDPVRDRGRRAARHRRRRTRARGASPTRTRATGSASRPRTSSCRRCRRRRCMAHADSPIGRRAGFAQHNLWVTPYAPDERRAAGEFPNQHAGGDGLPRWTAQDRPIAGTDVVVWYTFGAHALRAARGLARDAGRVHRLHADAVRLLRPQPGARRAARARRTASSTACRRWD